MTGEPVSGQTESGKYKYQNDITNARVIASSTTPPGDRMTLFPILFPPVTPYTYQEGVF